MALSRFPSAFDEIFPTQRGQSNPAQGRRIGLEAGFMGPDPEFTGDGLVAVTGAGMSLSDYVRGRRLRAESAAPNARNNARFTGLSCGSYSACH